MAAAAAAAAPTVTTNAASSVTSTSATLNGSANPDGASTTAWFRYGITDPGTCNDSFGTRAPTSSFSDTVLGAGSSAVSYSSSVSGLLPGTTYYFCALANNAFGTGFGTVTSFTTQPAAPVVTTAAASLVTATSAQLNATANPRGALTTGWFRYSTTSPGTCNDSFGTRAPVGSGGTSLGSGTSPTSYSQAISGLTPSTTYFFCAIASNSVGTGFGTVTSFTTPDAPAVTTNAASSVTNTSATLNGSANPNLASTTGWFRYSTTSPGTCNDTFGTRAPVGSGGSSLGSGTGSTSYSQAISGLTPSTTYFFCAIASNSVGTGFGTVTPFTTPATAPTVTTAAASLVTETSAQLNATANPGGAATTGWFRYSTSDPGTCNDSFGTRAPAGSGGTSLGSGTSSTNYSQPVSSLSPSTTYYVCAIASNSVGTTFGSVLSFSTPAPPTVTTSAGTSITGTSATLNGAANPHNAPTTGWYRYSTTDPGTCNDSFGTRTPISSVNDATLGAGSTPVSYPTPASGLLPATSYYVCAIAQNSEGRAFGAVLSFTTPATAPTVTTNAPSLVTATSAQLNATANPNGADTTGWFRYSTTSPGTCNDSFGTRAPVGSGGTSLGSGTSPTSYSQAISGLTPSTTYFFCAIAQNSAGTTNGAVLSFSTASAPPPPPPPPAAPKGPALELRSVSKSGRKLTVKLRIRREVHDVRVMLRRVTGKVSVVIARRTRAAATHDVSFTITLPQTRRPKPLRLDVSARETGGARASFSRALRVRG